MKKAPPKSKRTPRAARPRKTVARSRPSSKAPASAKSASRLIDDRIREVGGWRGETLARMRGLIRDAVPGITEEWKWSNPVWSRERIVCTGETYAKVVKLTFARGAEVPDPKHLFNSSLQGSTRRAIDIREGEQVDAAAFQALVKAAAGTNLPPAEPAVPITTPAKPVHLLSGGNPQIAKGDGDAPVQAYLAALPGWKSDFGRRLDALIAREVPGVQKAVRWNSPFYGVAGRGWFLSMHAFKSYLKVGFFKGASLQPRPPGGTPKSGESRWIDVYEGDRVDEAQMSAWVRQAAALPGWSP